MSLCDRFRRFTCLPYRPGKSLRVDPSAWLGMTKKAASVTNHHFHARGREFHDTDFNVNRPLFECCVDSFFELIEKLEHSRIQERQYLRHDDAGDVLDRVDPNKY